MKTLKTIQSLLILLIISAGLQGQNFPIEKTTTAAKLIASIISNTGSRQINNTVDIIKTGDPDAQVTGIITCMFATMEVLKQAVARNCNLIIVHEPLFYNHLDETKNFANDPVFLEKQKFINDHKLVIWRFHDYIHSMTPDGIESGMIAKLGWKNFVVKGTTNRFIFPETTLKDLLAGLKRIFPKNSFYVVGNPDMKLTRVSFAAGAPGSARHIGLLEDDNTDVVLAGEAQQWETYEYARDAVDQGRNKAVIFLGHIPSEEAGMDYCATWLKNFIRDVPVYFIESGSSYWSY